MICIEAITAAAAVWQCRRCYMSFHLTCIQAHAASSVSGGAKLVDALLGTASSWACPHCRERFSEAEYPRVYTCYCGKSTNPRQDPWLEPHTCGEPCQRRRICGHVCTDQCHSGPCSKCVQVVQLACFCDKVVKQLRCGTPTYGCGSSCGKTGVRRIVSSSSYGGSVDAVARCEHPCAHPCHSGDCPPCKSEGR